MLIYLTKKYDTGQGMMKKRTPIEYAEELGADEVKGLLKDTIKDLESKSIALPDSNVTVASECARSTSDRVLLAKARLEAFQDTRRCK